MSCVSLTISIHKQEVERKAREHVPEHGEKKNLKTERQQSKSRTPSPDRQEGKGKNQKRVL
ncbi:hypothetical protein NC651_027734 [Populus alba x Populus x berolinensis]|nr:hypothetical protein NC651_027734 [Populus alba x Populus x berolinensis]